MKKNMAQNEVLSGGNMIRRFWVSRCLGKNITNRESVCSTKNTWIFLMHRDWKSESSEYYDRLEKCNWFPCSLIALGFFSDSWKRLKLYPLIWHRVRQLRNLLTELPGPVTCWISCWAWVWHIIYPTKCRNTASPSLVSEDKENQHKSISSPGRATKTCISVSDRCYIHLVAWHPQSTWAELSAALCSTALGINTFVTICIHSWILQMLRAKGCACHEEWLPGLKVMGSCLVFMSQLCN